MSVDDGALTMNCRDVTGLPEDDFVICFTDDESLDVIAFGESQAAAEEAIQDRLPRLLGL